jgi:hypothetical protein
MRKVLAAFILKSLCPQLFDCIWMLLRKFYETTSLYLNFTSKDSSSSGLKIATVPNTYRFFSLSLFLEQQLFISINIVVGIISNPER